MTLDPVELAGALRAAFEWERPDGPFVGRAGGVEVEVDATGDLVDIVLDEATYAATGTAELGAAVAAAHREARTAALAGRRAAVLEVLERLDLADPGAWPA